MWQDPVVEEIRRIRDEHARQSKSIPTITSDTAYVDTGCGASKAGRLTCLMWPSLTWIQSESTSL